MTTNIDIRFELLMDAGNGAQKAGDILIKAFAKAGVFVFIEPIIPAEISPPKRTPHSMSGVVIRLSNQEITNIGSYTDVVFVEHEILLNRRLQDKEFNETSLVFLDQGSRKRAEDAYQEAESKAKAAGCNVIPFLMGEEVDGHIKALNGNGKKMFFLGLLTTILCSESTKM
jgi:Pyruvate:ferredoxin oxidoreductase and related 2-oxoacid:ferredoxin oxidoreductases, gamma subunit